MAAKLPNKEFTTKWIDNLPTPDPGQRHDYIDTKVAGFTLRVSYTGVKAFSFVYRHKGEPRRISLGQYPGMPLAEARDKAITLRQQVNNGLDPVSMAKQEAEAKAQAEAQAAADSYEVLLGKFLLSHNKKNTARYAANMKTLLTIPALLVRPVAAIKRRELIELVEEKELQSQSSAVHLKSYFAMFFDWLLDREYITANPAARMKKVGKRVPSRKRVLEDAELASIWRCSYQVGVFGPVVRCLMLSGARRTEIGSLEWVEVKDDHFAIPAARMKMSRDHVIPITRLIAAEMKNVARIKDCKYVFTSDGKHPVGGYGHAIAKLRKLVAADLGHEVPNWRLHDLRRTLVTRFAAMGVPDAVIKATVGHAAKANDTTNKVYNQHQYFDEKMAVLNQWCDFIESLNKPKLLPPVSTGVEVAA